MGAVKYPALRVHEGGYQYTVLSLSNRREACSVRRGLPLN